MNNFINEKDDSVIDKDIKEIVDYLNKKGYRTYASCDGNLNNHTNRNSVGNGYIAFLESAGIIELMAAYARDKENFQVKISNSNMQKPYELYGNIIEGNLYGVYFSNLNGERTDYFNKVTKNAVDGNIKITDEEKRKLEKYDRAIKDKDGSSSNLTYALSLHTNYQPYMRKEGIINCLRINNKAGILYGSDMGFVSNYIKSELQIPAKTTDYSEKFEDEEEFVLHDDISESVEIYFNEESLEKVIQMARKIKEQENNIPKRKLRKEPTYEEIMKMEEEERNLQKLYSEYDEEK